MNSNKFSFIISYLTGIIILFSLSGFRFDMLITKLVNISLVLLFGSLFGYYWVDKYFKQDEIIQKNSTAIAVYLGLIFIAIAIAINTPN